MLTIHGQYQDTDRLYIPRKKKGRGLIQVKGAYIAEIIKLMEYAESNKDPLIQIVRTHQHHKNLNTT
jgi:hypothetical protein